MRQCQVQDFAAYMIRDRPEPAARNQDDGRYKAGKKSGGLIATAVYGNFEAPEVVTLRR